MISKKHKPSKNVSNRDQENLFLHNMGKYIALKA